MIQTKKVAPHDPNAASPNPMRDRIIGAAFMAFMETGYAETSMLDIATRAKVSKRDLYANFPSKQAVLVACIMCRAARMQLSPDLPTPRSRAVLAATLAAFGATVLREVCHPHVVAMFRLAIANAERSPEVADVLTTSRSANRGALAGLLAHAQANAILCRGDPQQMMEQYFALLWGDLMVSRLLNAAPVPMAAEIDFRAHAATEAFLKLYAAPTSEGR